MSAPAVAVQLSADGAVGTSGKATIVWSITVFADATGTFVLRNGTGTGDTVLWGPETAAAVVGARHYPFPNGMWFPAGCFFDETAGAAVVTITYNQVTLAA